VPIIPRKCAREEIEADPRWREAIKPLFFLMYELGVEQVTLRKDGKKCHSSLLPDPKDGVKTCCWCNATNPGYQINCVECDGAIDHIEPTE
jgi:hypothetical protein